MPGKILVTNCAALEKKYGKDGLQAVLGAVKILIRGMVSGETFILQDWTVKNGK